MIGFIFIAFLFLLIGHIVVYKFFISIFPTIASQHLLLIRIIFLILTISFVLASILSRYYDNNLSDIFYITSASWLGFLFYFFMAAILYVFVYLIAGFIFSTTSVLLIGRILFFLAILVGIYGLYNAQNIIVTRVNISIPDMPETWKGRKAVFLSDIHFSKKSDESFIKKIAEKIKELSPDIIFNGGDLYDGEKIDASIPAFLLSEFKPQLGNYFVTGNHEGYGDIVAYRNAIKKADIKILYNESIVVDGLNIIGVDYDTTTKTADFEKILSGIEKDPKNSSILIKHTPFDLDIAEKNGIALQLSGHTHRAQMWPLNFITDMVYKGYDYGLKNFNSMKVLVTDGVGTWGPPMRVGTHAEIVLITFE